MGYGDGSIKAGPLPGRAGSIQAAVNLEIDTPDFTHINVKVGNLIRIFDFSNCPDLLLPRREGVSTVYYFF